MDEYYVPLGRLTANFGNCTTSLVDFINAIEMPDENNVIDIESKLQRTSFDILRKRALYSIENYKPDLGPSRAEVQNSLQRLIRLLRCRNCLVHGRWWFDPWEKRFKHRAFPQHSGGKLTHTTPRPGHIMFLALRFHRATATLDLATNAHNRNQQKSA